MVDGVRIYLPADNRLDFRRFLTADIAEIQIQKGYASVLDGPGAMGGAINLVTRKPTEAVRGRGQLWTGGRSRRRRLERLRDGRHAPAPVLRAGQRELFRPRLLVALRQLRAHGELAAADGASVSARTRPTRATTSRRDGRRTTTDEYTVNYIKQLGEKGAPLNVFNNPPVPPNSYWRWPYWDIQNTAFLSKTQLGRTAT